jgi:hypothetical protein
VLIAYFLEVSPVYDEWYPYVLSEPPQPLRAIEHDNIRGATYYR